ncbi:hypothetical protein F0562_019446 [Nyssa sinensis]|uniref:Uncharacterized protein n=1 Tax=Nyssa sinensis TaxID=561372 RepID=A0A5J5BSH4_9ASTE|nr:hypothetical protein F0562_019446 [Nyssa sinensis]
MSNQKEENPRLNASNSIKSEKDFDVSNDEVNNVEVEDASELRDLKASHFTPDSLEMLKALHIMATLVSEDEMRHRFEIEAAQFVVVEEQKDQILKLRKRLASDGYNLCLKKMTKAYPEVDIELLVHIKVSNNESGEYEDDKDLDDSTAP